MTSDAPTTTYSAYRRLVDALAAPTAYSGDTHRLLTEHAIEVATEVRDTLAALQGPDAARLVDAHISGMRRALADTEDAPA